VNLTPEIIGAFTVGAMGVVGVLQRYGILNLPVRRNGNGKAAAGMTLAEITACERRHLRTDQRLDAVENTQSARGVRIQTIREQLDRGTSDFSDIKKDINLIKCDVGIIGERMDQQYNFLTISMRTIVESLKK